MDGYPPGFAPHWSPAAPGDGIAQPPGFDPYIPHPSPSESWSWTPGMSAVPLEAQHALQQGQVMYFPFMQQPGFPAFSTPLQPVQFPGPSVSMLNDDDQTANPDHIQKARGRNQRMSWEGRKHASKRARYAETDSWRTEPASWQRQGEREQKGQKSGADLTPVKICSPAGQQRQKASAKETNGLGQHQEKRGEQPGKQSRTAEARSPSEVLPNKRPRSQDYPRTPLSKESGEQKSWKAPDRPRSSPGPLLCQLSTPLMRHSSPLQKSSPLADALKQKVQLWQTEKAGAIHTEGTSLQFQKSPREQEDLGNWPRSTGVNMDSIGGATLSVDQSSLAVNSKLVQVAKPANRAATPVPLAEGQVGSPFFQDFVAQFVTEVKESVSTEPPSSLELQAPLATQNQRSKPSIKERLSGLPLELETQASELANNPGSQTPLSRIKERLSFPTPQQANPVQNHFLNDPNWTAVNEHSSPVASPSQATSRGRGKKRSGSDLRAKIQGTENSHQRAAASLEERLTGIPWQPKDKEVWKIPEKLQKLLNEGLITDPLPAQEPPQQQAVHALNLMQGAARLSKKQLQRIKVQAQESKELLELQNTVGMQNVPVIMQLYWEAKRPHEDSNQGQPRFSIYEQIKILRQVARRSRKRLGKLRKKEAAQQQWTASQAQRCSQPPQNDALQRKGGRNGLVQQTAQPPRQEGESMQEKGSALLVRHDSWLQEGVQPESGQALLRAESTKGIEREAESRKSPGLENEAQPLRLPEGGQRTDSKLGPASVLKSTGEEQQAGQGAEGADSVVHQKNGRGINEDGKHQNVAETAVSDAVLGPQNTLLLDAGHNLSQAERSSAARTRPFSWWPQKRSSLPHSPTTLGVEPKKQPVVGLASLDNQNKKTEALLDERTEVSERVHQHVPAKSQVQESVSPDLEGVAAKDELIKYQLQMTSAPGLSVAEAGTCQKSTPAGNFAVPVNHHKSAGLSVLGDSKPQTLSPKTAKPQTSLPTTANKLQTLAQGTANPQTPTPNSSNKPQSPAPNNSIKPQTVAPGTAKPQTSAPTTSNKSQTLAKSQTPAPLVADSVLAELRAKALASQRKKEVPLSKEPCGKEASEVPRGQSEPKRARGQEVSEMPHNLSDRALDLLQAAVDPQKSTEGPLKQAERSQEAKATEGAAQHHTEAGVKSTSQKMKDALGDKTVSGELQSALIQKEGAGPKQPTLPRSPAVEAALKAAAKALSPQRVFPKPVVEASNQLVEASGSQKQLKDVQNRIKTAAKTEGEVPTVQGGLSKEKWLVPTSDFVTQQSISLLPNFQLVKEKQQKPGVPLQPVQSAIANPLAPVFGANLQTGGVALQSEAAKRDAGQALQVETKPLELQSKAGQLLLSSPSGAQVLFGISTGTQAAISTKVDSSCRLLIRSPGNATLQSVPLEPFLAAQGLSLPQVKSAFGGVLPPWLLGTFQSSSSSKPLQAPQTRLASVPPQSSFKTQSSSTPSHPSKLADRVTPADDQAPKAPNLRPTVRITLPNNQDSKPPASATATEKPFGYKGVTLFGTEASRPFISGSLSFGTKAGVNTSLRPAKSQPLLGKESMSTKSVVGESKQGATETQTSVQINGSSHEEALAETIKALRESIQKQTQLAEPQTNHALPAGKERKRPAYIKKKKNVLVRRVTPGKNTMKVPDLNTKPAKGRLVTKTPQKKALSWQRTLSGGNKSVRSPFLQGPKLSRVFNSPQKKRLKWIKDGLSPPSKRKQGDPFKTPQKGSRLGVQRGKKGSGLVKRVALKWTREGLERRRSFGRRSRTPILKSDNKGSLLNLFRQQRTLASTYSKSNSGLSLKRTSAVGLRGNLKWTLSAAKKRKAEEVVKASGEDNETTTSVKKRRVLAAARATARSKKASVMASLRRKPGAALQNRERVIPIGLAKYKMDPQGHSLIRVSEPTSSSVFTPPAVTPKRANVNGRTYVRQGATDRFVIDPASSRKAMASGRLKWSLQNARRRKVQKEPKLCSYFTKYGKCNREAGTCPFVHDPDKVAICTKFVLGRCDNPKCTLTHQIIPERMPVCSYFLEGTCTNEKCPFRHVNVAPDAPICRDFLRGFCPRGDKCPDKHTSVCPRFVSKGQCGEGEKCKFYHPTKRTWTLARALKEAGRKRKRARKASPAPPPDLGEGGIPLPADDESDSDAPPQRPKAKRRYFEQEETEVARRIKPAFLLEES